MIYRLMKKRKKKRIDSFKNWLLARDSASRINNADGNSAFFESSNWGEDDRRRMEIFDLISGSLPFIKLRGKIFDFGMMKDAGAGNMTIAIRNQDIQRWFGEFIECLEPKEWNMVNRIEIKVSDELIIGDAEQVSPGILKMRCEIPLYHSGSDVDKAARAIMRSWIAQSSFGQDSYQTRFFKWWMSAFLFSGNTYTHTPDSFEEAIIGWMKIADIEDSKKMYLDLIKNSNDTNIKRSYTELGTEKIIDYVKQGIKEFNINISDLTKGTNMLKRFGGFDR
jgi:hypothetical protein